MRRLAAVLVLLLLAACSSGDDADSGDPSSPYVKALTGVFTAGEVGPKLDDTTADCVATAIVELAGVPALTAADITPEELADTGDLKELGLQLPADAADTLSADFAKCDLGDAVVEPFIRAFADESGGDVSDDDVDCVIENTSTKDVEAGLAATFVSTDDGAAAFDAVVVGMSACPAAVAQLLVNGFETANGEAVDLSDDSKECLTAQVEANPEWAAGSFSTAADASGDEPFGAHVVAECPGLSS